MQHLGLGAGWRPELALCIERRRDLGFVEIIAESFAPRSGVLGPIDRLLDLGIVVVPHGVSLSLGGAEHPDRRKLDHLAELASRVRAPFVSEHIAFVRAGGREAGHLLPVPRTRESLEVIVENVREARASLPVPLALENIAALFEWPAAELDEATFLAEVLERTDTLLLLDLANLHAHARGFGVDALQSLERIPLERLAYVHVAGGEEREGLYHDTHAREVSRPVLELLENLCARAHVPGVLLERDDDFPTEAAWNRELSAIAGAMAAGAARGGLPGSGTAGGEGEER